MTATEQVILVNEQDQQIGVADKLQAHKEGLCHRAFSIFIFRKQPQLELLLQQRAEDKYHSPGLWTNTCCSHPRPGEAILAAGQRRLLEEMGISVPLEEAGKFHYIAHFNNGLTENEVDYVLTGTVKKDIVISSNPIEVKSFRWVTLAALKQEMTVSPDQFTPWLAPALSVLAP